MPGMMDTILNLGLNDETVEGLTEVSGNSRFAWDCYRRFIQMYGDVVMGVQARNEEEEDPFHHVLEKLKERAGVSVDSDLTTRDLKELVKRYKALILKRTRSAFPQDVNEQLWGAIGAVFGSWKNERAILYRQQYGFPQNGELQSMCKPWSSETQAKPVRLVWLSPGIRQMEKRFSTGNT